MQPPSCLIVIQPTLLLCFGFLRLGHPTPHHTPAVSVLLIVNPFSGGKKGGPTGTQVETVLKSHGVKVTKRETQRAGHALDMLLTGGHYLLQRAHHPVPILPQGLACPVRYVPHVSVYDAAQKEDCLSRASVQSLSPRPPPPLALPLTAHHPHVTIHRTASFEALSKPGLRAHTLV